MVAMDFEKQAIRPIDFLYSDKEKVNRRLECTAKVAHSQAARLRARFHSTPPSSCKISSARLSIEVWADDLYDELAYCRGVLHPTQGRVRILWLGRSGEQPVTKRLRGKRTVTGPGAGMRPEAERPKPPERRTLAEAIFGLVVAIAEVLGARNVELQPLDDGSGKLVRYYHGLGFELAEEQQSGLCWMEAMVETVSCLAPTEWLEGLVPASLDLPSWFHHRCCTVPPEPRASVRGYDPSLAQVASSPRGRSSLKAAKDVERSRTPERRPEPSRPSVEDKDANCSDEQQGGIEVTSLVQTEPKELQVVTLHERLALMRNRVKQRMVFACGA